ncbi:MAG: MBL fold metallo-hydrolase [Acidimicrobiales bacterium]|nr:MAG: MBL fold metallo-hydrolase [Acidimicrobiales bacterium]
MTLLPVDGLEVRVLVDNVTDGLSSTPAHVESEFSYAVRRGLLRVSGRSLCCAVHGLSLLLTARRGGRERTVLFDTGPEEYAFERNATRLGAPLGSVEGIVLSHGHWDHCGAVFTALNLARQASGRTVPVYMHPQMFRTRALQLPGGALEVFDDVPSVQDLQANGAEVVSTGEPQTLLNGVFHLSAEIPRVTEFEPGMPGQVRRTTDGHWEPDELVLDERWLAVHVADKGLVVFSGCSHAGIINVLEHCRASFPHVPVHAVVGGLHLSGPNEQHIDQTVQAMRGYAPQSIAAAHCTGWRAVRALAEAFGDDVVAPSAVGKRYSY